MAAGVADFIEVYDDALDRASCAAIVERLRAAPRHAPAAC